MKRKLFAFAILAGAIGYLSVSYVVADRFTRVERHPIGRTPQVAAATYEDVALRTRDGLTLRGWFFPVRGDRAAILIHGRHANRAEYQGRLEHIADFLIAEGFSVLLFDLRGHGDSDGERFSLGQLERIDVASAIDFVANRGFAEKRIALLGISLGAGTAIQELLLHPGIGALVSDSSYADAYTEVQEALQHEAGVPGWFTPGVFFVTKIAFGIDGDQVRPAEIVRAHPERAILFIHCDTDGLILVHHADDLRAASANSASALWIAHGCEHAAASDLYPTEYRARVIAFLDSQIPAVP
ncbi:MAG: alpha/beta fold hydrolase [Chloroflexota bacterium]|nr:alpha/beta fold hydrolase [Chloroflexota bacterium]